MQGCRSVLLTRANSLSRRKIAQSCGCLEEYRSEQKDRVQLNITRQKKQKKTRIASKKYVEGGRKLMDEFRMTKR